MTDRMRGYEAEQTPVASGAAVAPTAYRQPHSAHIAPAVRTPLYYTPGSLGTPPESRSSRRSPTNRTPRQRQRMSAASARRAQKSSHIDAGTLSVGRTTQTAQRATDLPLFPMRQQRRQEVWQFVLLAAKREFWHLVDQDLKNELAGFAFCLKCKCKIAYRPTSNKALAHMERHHGKEMRDFLMKKAVEKDNISRDLSVAFGEAATPQKRTATRQRTVGEQKRVNKLIAQWIARHFRPMLMVQDAGFIEFVRYITVDLGNVEVNLPKRTQLRTEIVSLARDLRDKVRGFITKGCHYYSVTSDISTSRNARSDISCTLHYVTSEFYAQSWTLEVRELAGVHDSSTIANALQNILFEWSSPVDKCAQLVRDAGANMVRAASDIGINHMSCVAHAIHLVVSGLLVKPRNQARQGICTTDSIEEIDDESYVDLYDKELLEGEQQTLRQLQGLTIQELELYLDETSSSMEIDELDAVRKLVQNFRSLAVHFRKSPKARSRLAKIQQDEMKTPPHRVLNLMLDCPTRWNCCYDMIDRFLELKLTLRSLFGYLSTTAGRVEFKDVKRTLIQPKDSDWVTISCLKALLVPFERMTRVLSGQTYPTLPLVASALWNIRQKISDRNMFGITFAMAGDEVYVDETRILMNACRKQVLELFDQRFAALEASDNHGSLCWTHEWRERCITSMQQQK